MKLSAIMLSIIQAALLTWPSILITPILCSLITFVSFCGDELLKNEPVRQSMFYRAAVDSSTHALIGGLCWAVVESEMMLSSVKSWMACFICVLLAASVDVDHFIAARSLDLQKATHLPSRSFFHNTTLVVIIVVACWIFPHGLKRLKKLSLMFLLSWLSHHLRDANHRGLWIYPFGHTSTISFPAYSGSILLSSLFVRLVYVHCYLNFQEKPLILV